MARFEVSLKFGHEVSQDGTPDGVGDPLESVYHRPDHLLGKGGPWLRLTSDRSGFPLASGRTLGAPVFLQSNTLDPGLVGFHWGGHHRYQMSPE